MNIQDRIEAAKAAASALFHMSMDDLTDSDPRVGLFVGAGQLDEAEGWPAFVSIIDANGVVHDVCWLTAHGRKALELRNVRELTAVLRITMAIAGENGVRDVAGLIADGADAEAEAYLHELWGLA